MLSEKRFLSEVIIVVALLQCTLLFAQNKDESKNNTDPLTEAMQQIRNGEQVTVPELEYLKSSLYKQSLKELLVKSDIKNINGLPGVSSIEPIIKPELKEKLIQRAKTKSPYGFNFTLKKIEEASQWNLVAFNSARVAITAFKILAKKGIVVENNALLRTAYLPNDPYFHPPSAAYTHNYFLANFPSGWQLTTGDPALVTAVIDTGVDINHPDLVSRMWRNPGELFPPNGVDDDQNGYVDDFQGWDFVNNVGWHGAFTWEDDSNHGTGIAGLIAAEANNSLGAAGGSFLGQYMNLKIASLSFVTGGVYSYGSVAKTAQAIVYAITMGADIINISMGFLGDSPILRFFSQIAEYLSIPIFTAAGNWGFETRFIAPANIKETISVGALDSQDMVTSYSDMGYATDLFAEGHSFIPSTGGVYRYDWGDGTSLSPALAASSANLLKAHTPSLTAIQVRQALRAAAQERRMRSGIVDKESYGPLDVEIALGLNPLLETRITSPGFFNNKFENEVLVEGFVRNPGGLPLYNASLSYRHIGDRTSAFITNLGLGNFSYLWNLSGLADGMYYLELSASTTPTEPPSIDVMLIKKFPRFPRYVEDTSQISTPLLSYGLESVDIDSDGDRDIIQPNFNLLGLLGAPFNENVIHVNNGNGNFSEEINRFRPAIGSIATLNLIPADLNRDGFVDFFNYGLSLTGIPISIYINDRRGYFDEQNLSSLGATHPLLIRAPLFNNAKVSDVDFDGDEDLIFEFANGGRPPIYYVYLLRNDGVSPIGSISITAINLLTLNLPIITPANLAVADINNDGLVDIIAMGEIFINQGSLVFNNETAIWSPGFQIFADKAVDLNNDGNIDLLGVGNTFYINNGSFFQPYQYRQTLPDYFNHIGDICQILPSLPSSLGYTFEVGDVDNDRLPDVIMSSGGISSIGAAQSRCLLIFKNKGVNPASGAYDFEEKTFEWLPDYQYLGLNQITAIDFFDREGDGDLDIVFAGHSPSSYPKSLKFLELETNFLIGDVDGDGRVTIADALMVAQYVAGRGPLTPAQLARADVNRNGVVDIVDALLIARIAAGLRVTIPSPPQEYCAKVPCPY